MHYYSLQIYYSLIYAWLVRLELAIRTFVRSLEIKRRGRFAQSTLISLFLRPWLERERASLALGAPLAALAIVGGVAQLPQADQTMAAWDVSQPVTVLLDNQYNLPVETDESGFTLPVQTLYGISQPYHAGHPGVDLRAPLGSNVVSVDAGVVEHIIYSHVGYGTHIYVRHDDHTQSLYAHLQGVVVYEGETVDKGQILAHIGMTGLSTGPHLHFELHSDGKQINPIPYLAKPIANYQLGLAGH